VIDKLTLVATLKGQHHKLQLDLGEARKYTNSEDFKNVLEQLGNFKLDLQTHLTLENSTFYPDYLRMTIARGGNIEKIKGFISEMVQIGEKVSEFLEKYLLVSDIEENFSVFSQELVLITKTLNLRVETEEDGIYDVYAATK
jgi:hypothetical protein